MGIINKVKSIKERRVSRTLTVKEAKNLTPNMRRITLHGEALENFPTNSEGAYIKLMFDQGNNAKPAMRTYTVAEQRSAQNEIDVDFMLHTRDDGIADGIAAPWATNAPTGSEISLFGPGPATFINDSADYLLLAADMTALPALAANLKRLPEASVGKAFIEILSDQDKQELEKPNNIELVWVVNETPGSDQSPLFHALEQAAWQDGQVAAWVACEFKTMKKIRQYLKVERGIEKPHLYISSYWKKGITEEQHKVAKQTDAQLQA